MSEEAPFQLRLIVRWTILVLIALIVLAMVVVAPPWTWSRVTIAAALAVFLALLSLAVIAPKRFGWCWRVVVGAFCLLLPVFIVIDVVAQFSWFKAISGISVTVFLCVPGFIYSVTGRISAPRHVATDANANDGGPVSE